MHRDFAHTQINRSELKQIKVIGEGAFGVVEKCIFLPQNRLVAVKRLKPEMKSKYDLKSMKMVANWTAMAQRKRLSRHASDRLTLDVSIKQKDGQLSGRTGSLMYMVGGWVGGWE